MADYTLSVRITGDATQAISAISKTGAAAAALGKQTDALNAVKMGGLSAGMTAAAASMGRAKTAAMSMAEAHGAAMATVGSAATKAGLALGATAALAVKSAADWESAWAGVTKTIDGADLGGVLEGQLRDMAKNLPSSHEEIAAVAEAAGQLGVKRKDIAGFTKTMIDLGQSTNFSAEEATTQIARFNNIMGLSNKQASNLGATLVDLGNTNATTEAEIMAMSLRIAAAGRQVKMTAPDILAISASLTSVGIGAEAGGSAMSRFFTKMDQAVSTGNKDLQVMAKTAGMTGEEFSKLFRTDSAQAFAAFEKGLGNLIKAGSGANQVMADMNINQVEMQRALKSLSLDADGLARNLGQGAKAWKENRALIDEATKRYATAESQFAMAKNRIKDGLIDMGKDLAPMIAEVVSGLSMLVDGFTNLPGPIKTAAGAFSLFGGAGMLAVGAAASLLPKIIELRKAMTELGMINAGEGIIAGLGGRVAGKAKTVLAPLLETIGGTAIGAKLGSGLGKAGAAAVGFGAAAKSAAAAAAPLAGTLGAIAAVGAAAGYGTEKAAAALQNVYSGTKEPIGELKNLEDAFGKVSAGAELANIMFGDTSSKMYDATQQMKYARDTLAKGGPAWFEMPSQDDLNSLDRMKQVMGGFATLDLSQTAPAMKQLVSGLPKDQQVETFRGLIDQFPEYKAKLEDAAKAAKLSADDTTLLQLATGELSIVMNAAGEATAATAQQLRGGLFNDLLPTSEEAVKAMEDLKQKNYEAAASFIDIGRAADQGLAAWHDSVMQQAQAMQAWGANMLQLKALTSQGLVEPAALEGLRAMGPQGAAILQEAIGEWNQGSTAGLQMLNDAFGAAGLGAANTFANAMISLNLDAIMQSISMESGAAAAQSFSQAIMSGTVDTMPELQALLAQYNVSIPVDGDISGFETALQDMQVTIDETSGAVKITGVDDEARATLADLGIEIDETTGFVKMDALDDRAKGVLAALGMQIDDTEGYVKVNGNTELAQSQIQDLIRKEYIAKVNAQANPSSLASARAAIAGALSGIRVTVGAVGKFLGLGHAVGGYITGPGTSTSDSIPAWLSNGEFVMRAAAVRKYGTDFMHRINENRFASGGQVGAVRFGSDPAKWLETNLKPVTETLKQWAGGLEGISATPTVGDNNRTKTLLDGRDFDLLQQMAGYLFSIDQNTKNAATRGSDSGGSSYSGGSGLGDSDADARKAEEEARRAEEEKKRQAEAALREYKALMEDVKRYGKQITDAFETLAEIQELMKPVAPEANSKGQITDSARERASEKNASNFERAVEQLQRLQETMGDLFTKYAETWQVKGHERAALDEFGKPVEWNVGGEINKQSSREQVGNLIGFLTQGFQGLLGELNIVKGTMGQKATPLDILKQLKVGEFANTETGSVKATAAATQATATNTGNLIGEVRALRDFVKPQNSDSGAPKMTSLYMAGKTQENVSQAATGGDTGLLEKVNKLTDQAAETYRMLTQTRITITPEVQILTIDDIQAHARVIVKTKLDYSDLQNQTNVAVSSIKPPPIVVPMVLGSSTM